jgi:phage terminase large subunit-like protein
MNSPNGERPEVEAFARFCRNALRLEDGTPLELHDFQRVMLDDLFRGVRETLILIPKKNGKSTLLGALALFHLCTTPDAECVIAAASRDQAQIMLRQAQGFIRRSSALQMRLQVKQREIVHRSLGGRIRVLASDVDTADGVIPTLALVDELHRHKSADLYGIFRDGLGPRNGQMVTISTAGDNEDSPLGRLRAAAYAIPGMVRNGGHRYVRSAGFAHHEWALDASDDRDDLELVKGVNPAPWQTIPALKERRESPSMTPWQWARFACGVWGVGSEPAFDHDLFESLAKPGVRIAPGRTVTLGFDGSRRWDATALIATDVETGHQVVVGSWERPPNAGPDWEISQSEVTQTIDYAFDRWNVWRLYADPPYWETSVDEWAGVHGAEQVVKWATYRVKQTAMALAAWVEDWRPGEYSHDGDEMLVRHIQNAVKQETRMRDDADRDLWLIRKESPKSPRKIDAAMAACLSWKARGDALAAGVLNQPVYSSAQW